VPDVEYIRHENTFLYILSEKVKPQVNEIEKRKGTEKLKGEVRRWHKFTLTWFPWHLRI